MTPLDCGCRRCQIASQILEQALPMPFRLVLVVALEKLWGSLGRQIRARMLTYGESAPRFLAESVDLPMPELRKDYRTLFEQAAMISCTL